MITIIRYHRRRSRRGHDSLQQQFNYIEADKERIAADLHDDFGALLSAIKIRLQVVSPKEPYMQENLDFAEEQIDLIMQKLRNISQNMLPSILKRKGLEEAIRELTEYMIIPKGIKPYYDATPIAATPDTEVHLYRIVQEIFNNIVKHSGATVVRINLMQADNSITLAVSDNGIGFNKQEIMSRNNCIGLQNILARATIIDAKIYLRASEGKGVSYEIETNCLWIPKP